MGEPEDRPPSDDELQRRRDALLLIGVALIPLTAILCGGISCCATLVINQAYGEFIDPVDLLYGVIVGGLSALGGGAIVAWQIKRRYDRLDR